MLVKNVEMKDAKSASFQVEADAAEFEAAVVKAYNKAKKSIQIPGFRQGKAPRAVVEAMYGAEVFYQDAMDIIAPDAFEFGYKNCELKIVGQPSISDVDLSEEKVLTFTFNVDLYPEVTLGQYKNLSAPKETFIVTDEDVANQIDGIRKRNGRIIDVEDRAAQNGDTVEIDFEGFLDGVPFEGGKAEGYSLELGSGTFVPGFEDQLVGMSIGEEKDIDITFPEDYTADLAGKPVVFKVKLNGISVTELPELDDEFVQDVSEFDTLDEYIADTRKDMERVMQEQVDAKYRTALINLACDNMTAEIPECMFEAKVEELLRNYAQNFGMSDPGISIDELKKMMGIDDAVLDTTIRPAAEYQVKQELLLEAVAKAEGIEITDEDLEEYIKGAAEKVGATADDIRNYFGEAFIRSEYEKEKATAVIIESATVSEFEESKEETAE